jgi:alkylation response protein AidB-like acyl-CoA dehydrogenase
MLEYFLTEEQKELKRLARKIAEETVLPVRERLDRESGFPYEIMKVIDEAGLPAVYVPEEYGGTGGRILDMCLVTEELSRIEGGVAVSYAATALGCTPIIVAGSEEQKKKYLTPVAQGGYYFAYGLTEAEAGSDAGGMQTTAKKVGDEYIINGAKVFCTNAGAADAYTVFAKTDPEKGSRGITAFIVEKDAEGFSLGKTEDKMGIRASIQRELIFEECRVPVSNRLGREGQGFLVAMKTLDRTRPGIGAQALGIAQGAFELAFDYAQNRVQFGQPISSFQAIQFMLSDMATKIEAARALLYSTARMIDAGVKPVSKESAMSKLYASDIAMEVTVDAVQIFGGYGYMRDYPVEKFMRDAKITQIYEGTNQVQRLVIGTNLIRGGATLPI